MRTLFINGKFAAQRITGVQRVAHNLVQALDQQIGANGAAGLGRVCVLLPPGAALPALAHIAQRVVGHRSLPLHLWEQSVLPWSARGGLLLNLGGAAPIAARRQVSMVHDAAVFDHHESYAPAFARWYRTLFRTLAWRGSALLTVSAHSRRRLALRLGIPPAQIAVVANGGEHLQGVAPDKAALDRLGLLPQRYLLAVGSDHPSKNFTALCLAFGLLQGASGIRLVIVGAADPRVFAAAASPGAGDRVLRTGAVDDAALKALYQGAIGLVFPSLDEGFGLPPLEAMSCGCPVAAAAAGAIPEVCGDAALYFDPTSVRQIADALQRLLDDAALRDRLRRAGAQQLQRHSWMRAAEALCAALQPRLRRHATIPACEGAAPEPGR